METDLAKVVAQQNELSGVASILLSLKQNESDPEAKATILSNPDTQRILHSSGDSYAHVTSDGTHFAPEIEHGLEGTDTDSPDKHARAYVDYATLLYSLASQVPGNSRASAQDVAPTVKEVIGHSSDESQRRLPGGIAQWHGSAESAGLMNSPVAGCEMYESCIGLGPATQQTPLSMASTASSPMI